MSSANELLTQVKNNPLLAGLVANLLQVANMVKESPLVAQSPQQGLFPLPPPETHRIADQVALDVLSKQYAMYCLVIKMTTPLSKEELTTMQKSSSVGSCLVSSLI